MIKKRLIHRIFSLVGIYLKIHASKFFGVDLSGVNFQFVRTSDFCFRRFSFTLVSPLSKTYSKSTLFFFGYAHTPFI